MKQAYNYNCRLIKHLGVLKEYPDGWVRELNLISWHENEPKYDIRDWSPDHERMSRGITLTESEIIKLCDFLEINQIKYDTSHIESLLIGEE